jgi:hypothetical protein
MPKLGDYEVNEATMLKLMAYVGVPVEGKDAPLMLNTRALVDNHIPDWETLARVEIAMMEYNVSFFANGKASGFLELIVNESASVAFPNVDGLIGAIVAEGKASLHELRTIYTLEDALDLYEVIAVTRYNEHLAIEHAKRK